MGPSYPAEDSFWRVEGRYIPQMCWALRPLAATREEFGRHSACPELNCVQVPGRLTESQWHCWNPTACRL